MDDTVKIDWLATTKKAYEAYCTAIEMKNPPAFEDLSFETMKGWVEAAVSVGNDVAQALGAEPVYKSK